MFEEATLFQELFCVFISSSVLINELLQLLGYSIEYNLFIELFEILQGRDSRDGRDELLHLHRSSVTAVKLYAGESIHVATVRSGPGLKILFIIWYIHKKHMEILLTYTVLQKMTELFDTYLGVVILLNNFVFFNLNMPEILT